MGLAVCSFCESPFQLVPGCNSEISKQYRRYNGPGICHDCAAKPGHSHHPGCDMAICIVSGQQAITCDHCEPDW